MADYDIGTAKGTIEMDASSIGRASAALEKTGLGMIAFAAVAVGAFVYVAKQAADFEHALSAVQAVTNATTEEMDAMRAKALELGSTTIYSSGEIVAAFESLGKAGIPVSDILNGVAQATVNLAAAAGTELAGGVDAAASALSSALKTFEQGSDSAEHFADVMVAAAASSLLSVDDLVTSLSYVGPVAHEAGVSFEELNTMLAILGDAGIKGSTAGTSLRGILLSLTPTSKKAENALKDLGLITADGTNKFYDMEGSLKPIPEVMQLLQDATKGLSEEQKIQAFNAIFQRRAMASALVLAREGATGFDDYAAAMSGLTAADIAATKIDNLSGDMTILKNSVDALIIKVGEPLQEMMRGWVAHIQSLVDWLNTLDPALLSNAIAILAIAGAIIGAVGGFLLLAGQMLKMYKIAKDLAFALKLIWEIFTVIAGVIAGSVSVVVIVIIAIIIALIAVFVFLYFKVDAVREIFDNLWDSFQTGLDIIKGWIGNVVGWFQDLWDAFQNGGVTGDKFREVLDRLGGVGTWLANAFNTLKDVVFTVIDALTTAFNWVKDNILPVLVDFGQTVGSVALEIYGWFSKYVFPIFTAFGELVAAVIARVVEVWNILFPAWQTAMDTIISIVRTAWDIIWPIIDFVLNLIIDIVTTAWDIITTITSTALDIIVNAWEKFHDDVLPIVMIIWNTIYLVIETIWNTIKTVVESALMIIKGIINVVTAIISGDWGKAWEGIKSIVDGVWHFIYGMIDIVIHAMQALIGIVMDAIVELIKLAWSAIQFTFETAMSIITGIWQIGWDTIQLVVNATWDAIKAVIETAINLVMTIIQNVMNLIWGIVQSVWNAVVWVFTDGISTVLSYMRDLPGNIVSALGDMLNLLVQKGIDTFTGLWNGIKSIWDSIQSWLGGIPGALTGFFVNAGTWLLDAGRKILTGLWDGMKDIWDDVTGWLGGLGSSIIELKGPPEEDAKLLIGNGELIMQSLAKGLENGYADVQKMLTNVAPSISTQVGISGALGRGNAGAATVIFDFSNGTFGEGAEEGIKNVVGSNSTLSQLTQAIRAGSR